MKVIDSSDKSLSYLATAAIAANTNINFGTVLNDNMSGAWSGTIFTAPEAGVYDINVNICIGIGAGGQWALGVYNTGGTLLRSISLWGNGPAGGSNQPANGSALMALTSGQQIVIRHAGTGSMIQFAASDFGTLSILQVKRG